MSLDFQGLASMMVTHVLFCIKPQIEQIRPFSLGHGVAAAAHVEIVLIVQLLIGAAVVLRLRLGRRLWLGLRVRLLIGAAVVLRLRLGRRLWLGLRVRLLIGAAVALALGLLRLWLGLRVRLLALGLDGCVAALWLAGGRIVV